MFCRGITWFICMSVAAITATDYSDQGVTAESSTTETVEDVQKTTPIDLASLLDASDGAVVTLAAGDTRLVAHRAVLAARSPVLAATLRRETPESSSSVVSMPDVEGPVLRQLVSYMYTLRAPQLPAMAAQLLTAADRYGLSALKAACEQQVAAQLTLENAAATALLALRHSCPSLRQAAVAFIRAHTLQVMVTQGWANAVVHHPHSVVELTRLIAELPAEDSVAATAGGEARQPHTADAAAPHTGACRSPPPDEATISHLRNLSREEKGRRLLKAANMSAVEELQALLAAGADVEARDATWWDWTALHRAADRGHVEAVTCLLEAGADIAARTSHKNTALHLAAWSGHAAVVRRLLRSSADPNSRGEDGWTPLHFAARRDNAEAAFLLLEAGADKDPRANNGMTPYDYAYRTNQHQLVQMLRPR